MLSDVTIGFGVDMATDGMLDCGVDMLPDMDIIVAAALGITWEVAVGSPYMVDVLADVPADIVSAIDVVDMFPDENVDGLATVMTPLEFTLSAPCEEPMPFC